ncbi:MAG: cytochrome bc complex cytochrome b subunit [Proteobacteria bacterium]|nr:cytochrome bc complex cytochrome b subunit [Pseudomonadota bacterium]
MEEQKIQVKKALDERFLIGALIDLARKKMVPIHKHSIWYYMGALLLILFMIQMVTGPLLLFYYKPAAETAHQSVADIMVKVPYGWLIRSVHHWASNLMIMLAFIHFFSTFLVKAYRRPREFTWLTGMVMFLLVLFLGYTGYTLPFDERAFFALNVGTDMPGAIPVVGTYVLEFLRGGAQVGAHTLNRFFALHVGVLPLALLAVLAIHIVLVQMHGMSIPVSVEKKAKAEKKKIPAKPMFPHFVWHDAINGLVLVGLVCTLAVCIPSELGPVIDYLKPAPVGVKPDWFFLWVYQILKWIPTYVLGIEGEVVGITGLALAALVIFCAPFVDWKSQRNQLSPLFTALGVVSLLVFLVFTAMGYFF